MSASITLEKPLASTARIGWFLVSLGALFRCVSFVFSANSGGDASARVSLTALWLQHPGLKFIFDTYPPGHFWLIGLFAQAFPDVTFAGRFLSLVLGIGSLYFVWKLTAELYGEWAGIFSLAGFAFYTMHIGYSTTSSAEVSYAFFMLAALYLFFSYYTISPSLGRLAVAGIALSVAESMRYEAWILCFGLGLACLWLSWQPENSGSRLSIGAILVFACTAGAWPIGWMIYCWRRFGDPFYQITDTNRRVAILLMKQPHSHLYEVALIPAALLLSLSPFTILAAAYGLPQALKTRARMAFTILTFYFAAVQLSEIARGKVIGVARYSITLGFFLAVLSGVGFDRIGDRIWPGRRTRQFVVVLVLLELRKQHLQRRLRVTYQPEIKFRATSELLPAQIDLRDLRLFWIKLLIGKIGADHEQHFAIHHRVVTGGKSEQTSHADVERIVVLDEFLAAQCVDDRRV